MITFRNFITCLLLTVSSVVLADDYAYLTIVQTNEATHFEVGNINKITFDETDMILHLTNGTEQKLPLKTLSKMFFSADPTNISTLDNEKSNFTVRDGKLYVDNLKGDYINIYDLSGKVIRSVKAQDAQKGIKLDGMIKGTYIVKAGTETKKFTSK